MTGANLNQLLGAFFYQLESTSERSVATLSELFTYICWFPGSPLRVELGASELVAQKLDPVMAVRIFGNASRPVEDAQGGKLLSQGSG